MLVIDAVKADIAMLAARLPSVGESALAAAALVLAAEMDKPANSATSKSMCARALLDTLDRLRAMVPAEELSDAVDDLAARRSVRQAKAASA